MSLNPNPNLAPMLAERRKDKRARAAANETAKYVRESLGRDDLAGLLEAGALDPATAIEMATPKAPDMPALVETYEYFKGLGLSHEDALAAAKAGAGGTNVTVGGSTTLGDVEKGWQMDVIQNPDGSYTYRQSPVEGGPAWLEIEAEKAKKAAADLKAGVVEDKQDTYTSVATQTIDDILMKIDPATNPAIDKQATGRRLATGGLAKTIAGLPVVGNMTEYNDVEKLLNSLKGSIAFERLQGLRDASPTGGALGAVTEKEMELLMGALGPLAPDMNDTDLLIRNLKTARRILEKFAAYPNAASAFTPQPGAPAPGAPADDGFGVEGAY
jgi:hypothetical protein